MADAEHVMQSRLDAVLNNILAMPVRRGLVEWLLKAAVEAAATAAVSSAGAQLERHEPMKNLTGVSAVELQRELVSKGDRDLAKRARRQAQARHAAAHPDVGLVRDVLSAMRGEAGAVPARVQRVSGAKLPPPESPWTFSPESQ
jgi:hypothetical protein